MLSHYSILFSAIATVAILENSSGMTLNEGGAAMPESVLTFCTIWWSEYQMFSLYFTPLMCWKFSSLASTGLFLTLGTEAVPGQSGSWAGVAKHSQLTPAEVWHQSSWPLLILVADARRGSWCQWSQHSPGLYSDSGWVYEHRASLWSVFIAAHHSGHEFIELYWYYGTYYKEPIFSTMQRAKSDDCCLRKTGRWIGIICTIDDNILKEKSLISYAIIEYVLECSDI